MSEEVAAFVRQVARSAYGIGLQAGVGAMETAGCIISYLAAHPEHIETFTANGSTIDLPDDWLDGGCLPWQAVNGNIVHPSEARAAREAKRAGAPA